MNIIEVIEKIPLLSKVFFLLFIAFSIIHLIFCFKEKFLLKKISKPFCMLFLGLAINVAFPDHPILYAAAYFGMAGDILLLVTKTNFIFSLGVFSFLLGHIFYYLEVHLILLKGHLPFYFHLIFWLIVLVLSIAIYPLSKKLRQKKAITLAGSIYYISLVSSLFTYIIAFIFSYKMYNPSYMWLSIVGSLLFIVSDTYLIYTQFINNHAKRKDFWIMLPYLLAQCLILLGFAFTYVTVS